jgi:hypothetical protein
MTSSWWARLPAARWSYRLAVVQTVLLAIGAFGLVLAGAFLGLLVPGLLAAVLTATLAALSGWVTHAWGWERPWAWWVLTVTAGLGLAWDLAVLPVQAPGPVSVVHLLVDAAFLSLLLHPDSRARIREPRPAARTASGPEGGHSSTHVGGTGRGPSGRP